MAETIKIKRSAVPGKVPVTSSINLSEIAFNTYDGKAYFKKDDGVESISEFITTPFSGSFNISGSINQVGDQHITGTVYITGGLVVSGSKTGGVSPTIRFDGGVEMNGYLRFDPVSASLDNSVSASYIYVSGSTNDLYFTQNGDGYGNTTRLRWIEGNLYTGLLNGGLITVTTGSTTFNVSSGSGIIVSLNASLNRNPYPTIKYVNWGNFTAQTLPYLTSSIQTFLGIDGNGNILQQTSPWSDGQYNTSISLGTVLHQNKSTVNGSITYPNVAYGYKQRTYDFIKAFGPLKLSGYTIITTGSLGLNVGSGTAFAEGRNYQVDPNNPSYIVDAGTSVSKIFRYYQSGSEFVQDTNGGLGYPVIDPSKYNNNGTLTSISPSAPYSIQRVFYYPNSVTKGIVVYYGNKTYASLTEAIANVQYEAFNEVANTQQNAIYLGAIAIKYNGAFTNPSEFNILPGGIFRSVGGSGGGGSTATTLLSGLSDVSITSPTYLQPLVYDSFLLKWVNTGSINAGLNGTASYANQASTASYANQASTASYASTSSYSLQSISASYATTSSYFDGNAINISSSIIINQNTGSSSSGVFTISSNLTGSYTSAFYKYNVISGSNARAGEFIVFWNDGMLQSTDYSAIDVGNTKNIVFTASIDNSNINLSTTLPSSGWIIKTLINLL